MSGGMVARLIILNPKGNQEPTYRWGLVKTTYNQVEILALYQGILILQEIEAYIWKLDNHHQSIRN